MPRRGQTPAVGIETWCGFLPRPPSLSSDGLGWRHLSARRYAHAPAEFAAPPLDHHLVSIYLRGVCEVEMRLNGERRTGRSLPGRVLLMASGQDNAWSWQGTPEVLHIYLSARYLDDLALELGLPDVSLVDHVETEDPQILALGRGVLSELATEALGRECVGEAYAQLLGLRLLRAHASRRPPPLRAPQALAPRRLRAVLAAMQDRLEEGASLDQLASVAGMSKFHFARAFKAATGRSPHQHLIDMRIDRARHLLGATRLPIVEIALACGFASQEHLCASFRRRVGTTPAEYRRRRDA